MSEGQEGMKKQETDYFVGVAFKYEECIMCLLCIMELLKYI